MSDQPPTVADQTLSARLWRSVLVRMPRGWVERVNLGQWEHWYPRSVICPVYHYIGTPNWEGLVQYPYKSQAQFAADLDVLAERYSPMGYDELARLRMARCPMLSRNRLLLSFDDGFACCFDPVTEMLVDRSLSGVFFILTDLLESGAVFFGTRWSLVLSAINAADADLLHVCRDRLISAGLMDNTFKPLSANQLHRRSLLTCSLSTLPVAEQLIDWMLSLDGSDGSALAILEETLSVDAVAFVRAHRPYLDTDQLRKMAAAGMTIGAHGTNHARLGDQPQAEVERQIVESCDIVRQITGVSEVPFAFAYQGLTVDRQWLWDLKRRYPFIGLYFDTGGFRADVPWVVNRLGCDHPPPDPTGSNIQSLLLKQWRDWRAWDNDRSPSAQ